MPGLSAGLFRSSFVPSGVVVDVLCQSKLLGSARTKCAAYLSRYPAYFLVLEIFLSFWARAHLLALTARDAGWWRQCMSQDQAGPLTSAHTGGSLFNTLFKNLFNVIRALGEIFLFI